MRLMQKAAIITTPIEKLDGKKTSGGYGASGISGRMMSDGRGASSCPECGHDHEHGMNIIMTR